MLNDIPYKNIMKNERRYKVWLLHDVDNNSFAKIAKNMVFRQIQLLVIITGFCR